MATIDRHGNRHSSATGKFISADDSDIVKMKDKKAPKEIKTDEKPITKKEEKKETKGVIEHIKKGYDKEIDEYRESIKIIKDLADDEVEAIRGYEEAIYFFTNVKELKKSQSLINTLQNIKKDEKQHLAILLSILEKMK